MKFTKYFEMMRHRPDRAIIEEAWIQQVIDHPIIEEAWIQQVIDHPIKKVVQKDGRIRRWAKVPELGNRYLRVILLADGETVHNAFFERRFRS